MMQAGLGVLLAGLLGGLLLPAEAWAAPATLARDTPLRAERYVDAAAVAQLAKGAAVDTIKAEAGWVQVRHGMHTGWLRASALAADGAAVAAVAAVEGGRNSAGNIVATSGVRSMARASRHALIIGIGVYDRAGIADLPGVRHDIASARAMAGAMSIPDGNVRVLRDHDATAARIGEELAQLNARVQPGDRVFIYFSGHGTRHADAAAPKEGCVEAWMAADSVPVTGVQLAAQLKPIADKTDKLMVLNDAGHAGGIVVPPLAARTLQQAGARLVPKFAAPGTASACAAPGNVQMGDLVSELHRLGALPQNLVHIASSRQQEASFDDVDAGGLATQAWRDCMLGEALDLDQSGGVSVEEIAACAQTKMALRFPHGAAVSSPQLAIGGNSGFIPVSVGVAPRAPVSAAAVGRPAGAALLDILAQRDPRREVELKTRSPRLRIGHDRFDLSITSARSGYLYLVLLGSDNHSYYLLFPNELDGDNRIKAGETLHLPRQSWEIEAQGPAGTDKLLAVVTASPRDPSLLGKDRNGPFLHAPTDRDHRATLQWLMGSTGNLNVTGCSATGAMRNISLVQACSDVYGAAMLDIVED